MNSSDSESCSVRVGGVISSAFFSVFSPLAMNDKEKMKIGMYTKNNVFIIKLFTGSKVIYFLDISPVLLTLFLIHKSVLLRTFAWNQKYSDYDGKNDISLYRGPLGPGQPGTEGFNCYFVAGEVHS